MRGEDRESGTLFSYVSCEARVPADHPLRPIRAIVDEALEVLSPEFERLYAKIGRPSIPPEKLMRTLLLQAFYGIRSERQLIEQLDYNLLFRWFVGLAMDAPVWDASVYAKNRDRLVEGEVAARFLNAVLQGERVRKLLSDDHFSVDGTLIDAWASMKSFRPKQDGGDDAPTADGSGRNGARDLRGQKRSNETHASTTDPDARLYRKADGQSADCASWVIYWWRTATRWSSMPRSALRPARPSATRGSSCWTGARGGGGSRSAPTRPTTSAPSSTSCAPARWFPHIAVDGHATKTGKRRKTRIDGRTTRHQGYAASQRIRNRIEESFGWIKTAAALAKTRHRGLERAGWMFTLTAAACNLIRLPKLLAAVPWWGRWRRRTRGETAFGVMPARDLESRRSSVFVTSAGLDQMDEVTSKLNAWLLQQPAKRFLLKLVTYLRWRGMNQCPVLRGVTHGISAAGGRRNANLPNRKMEKHNGDSDP
jgi:transposase